MERNAFSRFVETAPSSCGCYIFRDNEKKILYIGKSINIKSRLSSYYENFCRDTKSGLLVRESSDIETISTENEKDALLLENNLIKRYKPRFNVLLKDDKQYPLLEIDINDDFPALKLKRKIESRDRIYFGPFISSRKLRENIKYLRRLFKIRACTDHLKPSRDSKPCLYSQMGACPAPCCCGISREDYRENINNLILFLKGKKTRLLEILENKMMELSDKEMYEEASYIRDKIIYLKSILEKQKVIVDSDKDIDVISCYMEGEYIVFSILYIRNHNLIDKKDIHTFTRDKIIDDSIFYNLLIDQYSENRYIPDIIVIDNRSIDSMLIKSLLEKNKKGLKIITHPKKQLYSLLMTARRNAKSYFDNRLTYHHSYSANIMESLKLSLNLENKPSMIDCFDISNLFGKNSVGVCIRFENLHPKKTLYRKFSLKSRIDDYESIKESVYRRYKAISEEDSPDLILIDGGRSQLSVAVESLQRLHLNIPAVSISKINDKNQLYEKVHTVDGRAFDIKPGDSHFLFLARVRDEAHRFAVMSHRKKRHKAMFRSFLDEIPGIGPARKKALLEHFRTPENIARASLNELSALKGISGELAATIKAYCSSLSL